MNRNAISDTEREKTVEVNISSKFVTSDSCDITENCSSEKRSLAAVTRMAIGLV